MSALVGYMTVKEAATILGISQQRVRQLTGNDQLKNTRKVGPALIIPESEVLRRKEEFPPRSKRKPGPKTKSNGHK